MLKSRHTVFARPLTTMSAMPRGALLALAVGVLWAAPAHADAVASLRSFVKDVQSGQASFKQTVTSPDGKKARTSTGMLEFQRPNRFRFAYDKPMEQLIVGDGQKVWFYDADLNQVTEHAMNEALSATPAAFLSGSLLEKNFALKALPPTASPGAASATPTTSQAAGLIEWAEALPRVKEGQFQSVRVGFKGGTLVALEVLDSFGQKTRMDFTRFDTKAALPASRFQFTPPAGVDVLRQP